MSALDWFRTPRIVKAELAAGALAIAGGRTAVVLEIEGAGVLVVGDARVRFWRGFRGTVRVRIADQLGAPIAVRVHSLVGSAERAIAYVPLPAMAPAPSPPRAHVPAVSSAVRMSLELPRTSVHPRGFE